MAEPDIRIMRAYDTAERGDGWRVLVDRVWPRGRSRKALAIDAWCKSLAPSDELRKWFGHDPARWKAFQRRYRNELREQGGAMDELLAVASRQRVTLVFGASDAKHNQAVILRRRLLERHRKRAAARRQR